MAQHQDDVFGSSRFLSARGRGVPRKTSSRQSLHMNGAPRGGGGGGGSGLGGSLGGSLADALDDDTGAGSGAGSSRFSLAHELAAALMPEPSAGAALLDEFGIDYDEGAEGIDEGSPDAPDGARTPTGPSSFAPSASHTPPAASPMSPTLADDLAYELDSSFGSPAPRHKARQPKQPEQDPMDILAQDLASTETFLSHLRRIDADLHGGQPAAASTSAGPPAPASSAPGLEQLASAVIRRLTDTAREREGQVRELLEAEREFRKIAGELGGDDVLGALDELERVEGLVDERPRSAATTSTPQRRAERRPRMEDLPEEQDWESEMERKLLGDGDDGEQDEDEDDPPLVKESFHALPAVHGPATPAASLVQLADLRTFTVSLGASLATIVEQTQVNGAATADAGRKIRALKNKLGGWRTEWEVAERSRVRIERWEAGAVDGSASPMAAPPWSPSKRIDGRKIVEEHLRGYERALAEASMKIGVIMASAA